MAQLWGRCPQRDPWFPIEDPSLEANYLCPVCLQPAESVRQTRPRTIPRPWRRRKTG